MASNISIVLAREFTERVKKKSFIITTLLMPILMVGLMCLPILIMTLDSDKQRSILVVDDTPDKIFARNLKSDEATKFIVTTETLDSARADHEVNSIIFFPEDIVTNPKGTMQIYNNGSSSLMGEERLVSMVNEIITDQRLASYNLGDLKKIIEDTRSDVQVQSFSNNSKDDAEASSTGLSYALGIGMLLLLYMALLIYGQMVMTSIIEEKNNRVLEIVVTSVKPFQLMLGKIAGVGLAAVLQLVIWGVLILITSVAILPLCLPADAMSDIALAQTGTFTDMSSGIDQDFIMAFAILMNPLYLINLFIWLIIFLVGGFLLYSSFFAAIGSAVDSVQDASQFTSFAVIPIVLGLIFGQAAATNPDSSLSMWTSLFPLTSPMVMMTRLPFGIPLWQSILSAVILFLTVALFIWFAGKIYRVGIFMYGKKPTIKDLIRWAKYK